MANYRFCRRPKVQIIISAGDQKCKSMRKLAGRTLIDILPPKVNIAQKIRSKTFIRGNIISIINVIISFVANCLP